jgi:hypothetical protein
MSSMIPCIKSVHPTSIEPDSEKKVARKRAGAEKRSVPYPRRPTQPGAILQHDRAKREEEVSVLRPKVMGLIAVEHLRALRPPV